MTAEPVGLSRDLARQRVMRAEVRGTDIALWRSRSGVLSAWHNRCPHRGMRLSHGFVRGEALACLYHGWHYNTGGHCAYIPAHPELTPPDTIQTRVYSATEQGSVLWVATEGPADPFELPDSARPVRSITFECARDTGQTALINTPVNGFDGPNLVWATDPETNSVLIGACPDGRPVGWVLSQELGAGRVTFHILIDADQRVAGQIALSRWAEAARRGAEAALT